MAGYKYATALERDHRMKHAIIYNTRAPVDWAPVAIEMAQRWGMVSADDGGEDSSGRFRPRLMSTDEVVKRACDTAQALYEEFEKRGVILDVPAPSSEEESTPEKV